MHTYPMHDTHYNPQFWAVPENESNLTDLVKILCEIIDINGKMKKDIQKLETRQEIEEKFKKIYW